MSILFNKPYFTGNEVAYMQQACNNLHLSGDGEFTFQVQKWLEHKIGCNKALLTHSCTAALEMAAILIDAKPGDEIIMPSYTFVSTANAFVLRGATPVFVDIHPDTLNIDETKIEAAITKKTKAIVPVHYAGVSCAMDTIMDIANHHSLYVIEDAAQAILASYNHKPLGSFGHLATLSFHASKNIQSGEGGALLINDSKLIERAEIIREKGTNRSQFFRGQVDKYTWIDIGSSYLPNEITAAFLFAQLEQAENITVRRLAIWNNYHHALTHLETTNVLRRPIIPSKAAHNGHLYYLLLNDFDARTKLIAALKKVGIYAAFHYVPLHNSKFGKKYSKVSGSLAVTEDLANRLLRLPLWVGIEGHQESIIQGFKKACV
jgi:dTDP-4-amino-4,6-dideoxygalactose transaminase